jgi:hypothetical protein
VYVVVQRVVSPTSLDTGVNTFVYLHPGLKWQVPPKDLPATDPGRLERKSVALEPNGNVVRSNLEVVAPDDIDVMAMRKHLMDFFDRAQFNPLPWEGVAGPCFFRLHMVPSLYKAGWAREAKALASAGGDLVMKAREAKTGRVYGPRR